MRRLQDAALQQEREKLQQQAVWTQERQLLERELQSYKEKVLQFLFTRTKRLLNKIDYKYDIMLTLAELVELPLVDTRVLFSLSWLVCRRWRRSSAV